MSGRALICGISGQDGAYLARLLTGKGYEVHGVSRGSGAPPNLVRLGVTNVRMHQLANVDVDAVGRLLGEVGADEVYYLAAQSSVGRSFDAPIETWRASALDLVAWLKAAAFFPGIRFVNAASGDCFGITTAEAPAREDSPFAPRSPYAAAKCAGHHAVTVARLADRLFACSAFLFSHESPLRSDAFVTGKVLAAVRRIAAGSTERLALGDVEVVRDWGFAPDYVEAMWRMARQDAPRDFVIATGRSCRLADYVEKLFAQAGLDWRDHVDVGAAPRRPADIPTQYADPGRARAELGWAAATTIDALPAALLVE
jgi:GDPmannose 4,6-dehydratase